MICNKCSKQLTYGELSNKFNKNTSEGKVVVLLCDKCEIEMRGK